MKKSMTLATAREQKRLDKFAAEHPSTGDKSAFDALLKAMATKTKPEGD